MSKKSAHPIEEEWSPYSLTLTDQIYFRIKDLIFKQQIVPGQKLHHDYLSERLKVSTTPVREAINRLVQEDYVRNVPRKGYYLNEITIDEAEELYAFRELIELYTVEKACALGDETPIKDLQENAAQYFDYVQKPICMERLLVDQEFHLGIAGACDNRFIKSTLEKIFARLILKRSLEGFPQRGAEVYKEHEMILNCIMGQEVARAKELVREHIRKGRDNFISYLKRRKQQTSAPDS